MARFYKWNPAVKSDRSKSGRALMLVSLDLDVDDLHDLVILNLVICLRCNSTYIIIEPSEKSATITSSFLS
jgi:hypothetical protein